MKNIYTATHTPGPWRVFPTPASSIGSPSWEITDDIDKSIAWIKEPQPRSRAEMEANARLIAAAPELLGACRAALETIQGQAALLRTCGAAYGIGATLATLEAAITKAERGEG